MKFKHSNSVFWEYVLVCASVALISCLVMGFLLGSLYLRTINERSEEILHAQTEQAVQALDSQLNSMQELSVRLSSQQLYHSDRIFAHKYNVLVASRSITQYRSYCPMASQFALLYERDGEILILQDDGTTTELTLFLSRCGIENTESIREFLFTQEEAGRVIHCPESLLFAYPIRDGADSSDATLCFVVRREDLQERIRLASALKRDGYRLVYRGVELVEHTLSKNAVSYGDSTGFRVDASVPEKTLTNLLTSTQDVLLLSGCLLLLFASIFVLAWRCYRPIRFLSRKYSDDTGADIKNELLRLDQVITQTRTRSQLLDQKASDQSALLQDYVLLMLLNNSGTVTIRQDLANAGVNFPYSHFAVIALTPCKDQFLTEENLNTLKENIGDITGDIGSMYAVVCSHASQILAIVCNPEKPELYEVLQQRLYTYLNAQALRFLVGTGPLTDRLAGISASYLTALSQLRQLANAQAGAVQPAPEFVDNTDALIKRIVTQIEQGDCPQALMNLETYMSVIEQNQSELIRRYSVLNITMAVQQLCNKLSFRLSENQMSMLLSMRSVQTIHFALLQLIPALCIHAQKQNSEAILPTGRLVMDYLRSRCCDCNITVQQIAEDLGIGINRASALVREETGHSFKTVVTQFRMEKAKLLLASGIPVAEVADQTGYNSASYFIKVFKAAEGITPDAYRRMHLHGDVPEEPLPAGEDTPEEEPAT